MALPGLNYAVLDANKLRDRATVEDLIAEYRRSGQRIMLPWVHVFEQSKRSGPEWWDRVHEYLRLEPRAVSLAKPSFVVMQEEQRTLRPRRGLRAVEDRRNTPGLRSFLSNPTPTRDIGQMRADVVSLFRRLHTPGWTTVLEGAVTFADTPTDRAEEKAIRQGLHRGDRGPLRETIVSLYRDGRLARTLAPLFDANSVAKRKAKALVRFPSMNALTILAHVTFGLRRRLQTPKTESEDNPACDIEAVLIAALGRRLVTDDAYARHLDEDLRIIARRIWA
jgi:hypothetical protein